MTWITHFYSGGYEFIESGKSGGGYSSEYTDRVRIHQLVAISAGYDPHKIFSPDWDVHHKNGITKLNSPENLDLIPHGEHSKQHYEAGDYPALSGNTTPEN